MFTPLSSHCLHLLRLLLAGVETISHLRENGRITIMFCAFEGAARISRLFGTGTVYEFGTPEYFDLIPPEKRLPGSRAAIVIDVYKASTVSQHIYSPL